MIVILIPAAGASTRMRGHDKLLEEIGDEPLLRRQSQAALATGWPVVVCLRADRPMRRKALAGLGVQFVDVAEPEAGMAGSIRSGMTRVPFDASGVMIVPADMPDLKTEHFLHLAEYSKRDQNCIWRGSNADRTQGHPVLFPGRLFDRLRTLPDAEGAKGALQGEDIKLCPLPDQVALTDLDTPEDWARWRAAQL